MQAIRRAPSFGAQDARSDDPDPRDWLAAIIEGSDDAIISKGLGGNIRSWNLAASRLFGYAADEVIGKPITILIPPERLEEEPAILAEIKRGNRVDHFETVRLKKDGSPVDISLTVSPIHNRHGEIVGASKIARDISDKRRAGEQKDLLLHEMNHRVKNLFALAGGLVNVSARAAQSVPELVSDLQGKFLALARAHSLTVAIAESDVHQITTLQALVAAVTEPYSSDEARDSRIVFKGSDFPLGRSAVTSIALLLHEFATNALKYGALVEPSGRIVIECSDDEANVRLIWREIGVSRRGVDFSQEGFGSRLTRATVDALAGSFSREFTDNGLQIHLNLPRAKLSE